MESLGTQLTSDNQTSIPCSPIHHQGKENSLYLMKVTGSPRSFCRHLRHCSVPHNSSQPECKPVKRSKSASAVSSFSSRCRAFIRCLHAVSACWRHVRSAFARTG